VALRITMRTKTMSILAGSSKDRRYLPWRSNRPGQTMTKTSSWTALKNPVFRKLWIASLLSGTCVAAHDTAATWVMNMLTPSPFLISVMSTVASLPSLSAHAACWGP